MNKEKFYFKYPLFHVIFCILWLTLGLFFCFIASAILVRLVTFFAMCIIRLFYEDAFALFVFSGRMDVLMSLYTVVVAFGINFIFLIAGLEFVSRFVERMKCQIDYGDMLKDVKNQILFKKSDDNI